MVEYDVQEHELVKRLDKRIIPILTLLYFVTQLQGECISNLRIDLYATKNHTHTWSEFESQFNGTNANTTTIGNSTDSITAEDMNFEKWVPFNFGLGFVLFVFPFTFLMKILSPSRWFSFILFLFGFNCLFTIAVTNFTGFAISQFFSGALLSGILPSIMVYIPHFYIKEEYGKRFAYIISIGEFSSTLFGQIIASILGVSDNSQNMKSWKLMLIINAVLCFSVTVLCFFRLPDFLSNSNRFLTPADRVLALQRVQDPDVPDQEGVQDEQRELTLFVSSWSESISQARPKILAFKFHKHQFSSWIREVKFLFFSFSILFYSISTTILNSRTPILTFIALKSGACFGDYSGLLVSTIPKFMAIFSTVALAHYSDLKGERALLSSCSLFLSSLGFLIIGFVGNAWARFVVLFFVFMGMSSALPLILCYALDHAHGETTRVLVSAGTLLLNTFGYSLVHLAIPKVDTQAFSNGLGKGGHMPLDMPVFVTASVAAGFCAGFVLLIRWVYRREEDSVWEKTPGLRRLMNDNSEAGAWDFEMDSNADIFVDKKVEKSTKQETIVMGNIKKSSNTKEKNQFDKDFDDDDGDWN